MVANRALQPYSKLYCQQQWLKEEVFPGNTTDVTTVERVKADLKGWKLGRCVFVGDAGMKECWRTMKSGLRMRPVYHWAPHRLEAHVKLCVLALLLERIAELRAGDTWRNVVAQLETIKVVEYVRGEARIRQTTEVRGEVAALLKKLKVALPPRLHGIEAVQAG